MVSTHSCNGPRNHETVEIENPILGSSINILVHNKIVISARSIYLSHP